MRKLIYLLSAIIIIIIVPIVYSVAIGGGVTPDIRTEDFKPRIWLCDSRLVSDDNTEPGRISAGGQELKERINNYAFEGEKINWKLLVMDKNGIEKLRDVFVSIGPFNDARRWVTFYYNDTNCMNDCDDDYNTCFNGCYVPDYDQSCLNTCLPTCTINNQTNQTCVDGCFDQCFIGLRLDQQCVGDCNSEKTSCESGCLRTGRRLEQNDIEANCALKEVLHDSQQIETSCNARIGEEELTYVKNDNVMAYYECIFTVETPASMYGEYWVTLEAEDLDNMYNHADEVEYWLFNEVELIFTP